MFFERMGSRPGSISDAVYTELLATLHGTLVPVVLSGAAQALTGAMIMWQTGDLLMTGVLSGLGVLIAVIRIRGILAFQRRLASGLPLSVAEASRYGRRYVISTTAAALVVGLLVARSLMLDDPICMIMMVGIGFGYGNGVIARLSLLPIVAAANMALLGIPAIVVSLWRMDVPHTVLAILIGMYFVDSFEMVRRTFNSTVNHILLKQKYEQQSRLDPLTGLFNRSVLDSDLPRLLAADDAGMIAVYAIDLDHFKPANDRFGHPVGDALLRQVADRLTSLSRAGGLIIRMGGDEFVLVETLRARPEAETLARRILETVSAPYRVDGHDIVIGASIGVAMAPDHGGCVETLLSRSDQALYQAKARRGGYVIADDLATAKSAPEKAMAPQRAA
jgi:diguanylate cyclase (GGDEF)-like protein